MFQDNPLLAQLKQKLHAQTPRVEGLVKVQKKALASSKLMAKKLFHSASSNEKVMHGDRVIAAVHTDKDREFAEPEELVEPF